MLRETIGEAAKTVHAREEDVNAARIHLAEAERELKLLTELAQVRGVDLPETVSPSETDLVEPNGASSQARGRSSAPRQTTLLAAVIEILAERGEPMQIRDLMAAVQERGVRIPGSGQQANLIAHISRDRRIARPRRGFYGLRELGVEDAKPARAKGRRSRRRPGTAA